MKIRYILLSLLGLAAYLVIASYPSRILKDAPSTDVPERVTVTAPQALKSPAPAQEERTAPARPEPQPAVPADTAVQLAPLQQQLAAKDQQVRQLLEAQEAIAATSPREGTHGFSPGLAA